MKTPIRKNAGPGMLEIGWREVIGLPDFGIAALHAKIDTGARTSALHTVDLEVFEHEGHPWVEFHVPMPGVPKWKRCATRIVDDRPIKNTSGNAEHRYIVETTLVLGSRHWRIEVSLADRANMGFDMILGRTAIRRRRILVNPGSSFRAGQPSDVAGKSKISSGDGLTRTLERGIKQSHDASNQGDER